MLILRKLISAWDRKVCQINLDNLIWENNSCQWIEDCFLSSCCFELERHVHVSDADISQQILTRLSTKNWSTNLVLDENKVGKCIQQNTSCPTIATSSNHESYTNWKSEDTCSQPITSHQQCGKKHLINGVKPCSSGAKKSQVGPVALGSYTTLPWQSQVCRNYEANSQIRKFQETLILQVTKAATFHDTTNKSSLDSCLLSIICNQPVFRPTSWCFFIFFTISNCQMLSNSSPACCWHPRHPEVVSTEWKSQNWCVSSTNVTHSKQEVSIPATNSKRVFQTTGSKSRPIKANIFPTTSEMYIDYYVYSKVLIYHTVHGVYANYTWIPTKTVPGSNTKK